MINSKEPKYFSVSMYEYFEKHKIFVPFLLFFIYLIMVSGFLLLAISSFGGLNETICWLNNYPKQDYINLEQELQNIIVDDKIVVENLSDSSIKYSISYFEDNSSSGEYTITLSKSDASVTSSIGKNLNKESLKVTRKFSSEKSYRIFKYFSLILVILIKAISLFAMVFFLPFFILFIIDFIRFIRYTSKNN